MTPAEHKTEAETRVTAMTTLPTGHALDPNNSDQLVIEAHAHLAQALGTGTHYTTADSLLTDYDTARNNGAADPTQTRLARLALSHAVLADR